MTKLYIAKAKFLICLILLTNKKHCYPMPIATTTKRTPRTKKTEESTDSPSEAQQNNCCVIKNIALDFTET